MEEEVKMSLGDIVDDVEPVEKTQEQVQEPAGQDLNVEENAEPPSQDGDKGKQQHEQGKQDPTPEEGKPEGWAYAAYKDKNEKLQAATKRINDLEARQKAWEYEQQRLAAANANTEIPDVFDDAQAYTQYVQQQAIAPIAPVLKGIQEQLAAQKYGDETMQAASDWFNSLHPQKQAELNATHGNSADPYGGLINDYKQSSLLQEIGGDIDAYREKLKADIIQEMQSNPAQQQGQQQTQFAPSIAGNKSTTARTGPKWTGPPSIRDILAN